ncbi:MAG TPA: hypothetical protein VJX67_07495 [Blastocatellia bacterium]|nr:hypothetical protein [Blastocatellia bacterium]
MGDTKMATVEPGNRIEIPPEWVADLGLQNVAELEKTPGGIIVRPCPPVGWDQVYAKKLAIGSGVAGNDLSDVSADDLLF